jgi:hypothetical protein
MANLGRENAMTITSVARWNAKSREDILKAAKKVKPIHVKYGGEFRLEQIHTGPHSGQWLVSIVYPDWETYGKATQALANDAEHTKLRSKFAETSRMEDRTILVGYDV